MEKSNQNGTFRCFVIFHVLFLGIMCGGMCLVDVEQNKVLCHYCHILFPKRHITLLLVLQLFCGHPEQVMKFLCVCSIRKINLGTFIARFLQECPKLLCSMVQILFIFIGLLFLPFFRTSYRIRILKVNVRRHPDLSSLYFY